MIQNDMVQNAQCYQHLMSPAFSL